MALFEEGIDHGKKKKCLYQALIRCQCWALPALLPVTAATRYFAAERLLQALITLEGLPDAPIDPSDLKSGISPRVAFLAVNWSGLFWRCW